MGIARDRLALVWAAIVVAAAWLWLESHSAPAAPLNPSPPVGRVPLLPDASGAIEATRERQETNTQSTRLPIGSIVTRTGKVVARGSGVPLHAMVCDGQGASTWTDPDTGEFAIATDSAELTASARGYREGRQALSLADRHVITLDALHSFAIRVVNAQGAPVAGADIVHLQRQPASIYYREVRLGQTRSNGWFELGAEGLLLLAKKGQHISKPRHFTEDKEDVICDSSTTARVRVLDQSSNAINCAINLSILDASPGLIWRIGASGEAGAMVPEGTYAASIPGHGPIQSLTPSLVCDGQILITRGGTDLSIRVAKQAACVVTLRDSVMRQPVRGSASLETLEPMGWRDLGWTVDSDEDGRIDLARLRAAIAEVADSYKRVRFSARAFTDAYLPFSALSDGADIDLTGAASKVRLQISRDGVPYLGYIIVKRATEDPTAGITVFDGHVTADGIDVTAEAGGPFELYSSRSSSAQAVAAFDPKREAIAGIVHVELPRSSEIRVMGGAADADVGAVYESGERIRGQFEDGTLRMCGLFPGDYTVGLSDYLGADVATTVEVRLEAGQHVAIPWAEHWKWAPPVKGRVQTVEERADMRRLRVIPCSERALRASAGVYGAATPLRADGSFELTRVPASARSIAVIGMLHGGAAIVLGQFPIGVQSNLLLTARRVTLVFDEQGPPSRAVLLAMPVDAQGRSAEQWVIPCSGRGALDLGLVPDVIQSAQLIVSGKGRTLHFPTAGECLVRVGP